VLPASFDILFLGSGRECTMPTKWIHGGTIPPCPCGAASEDQVPDSKTLLPDADDCCPGYRIGVRSLHVAQVDSQVFALIVRFVR
jgi:hypothetical protein